MFAAGSDACGGPNRPGGASACSAVLDLAGAVLNVPWLALGTVYLLAERGLADRVRTWLVLLSGFAAGVVRARAHPAALGGSAAAHRQGRVRRGAASARRRRLRHRRARHHRRRAVECVAGVARPQPVAGRGAHDRQSRPPGCRQPLDCWARSFSAAAARLPAVWARTVRSRTLLVGICILFAVLPRGQQHRPPPDHRHRDPPRYLALRRRRARGPDASASTTAHMCSLTRSGSPAPPEHAASLTRRGRGAGACR